MDGVIRSDVMLALDRAGFDAFVLRDVWWVFRKEAQHDGVYVLVSSLDEQARMGTVVQYVSNLMEGMHK